ncbi:chymotrypsin-like elastase family member 2A [Paramacrobiotus metropolitanus]|uniref:chymotrypsin-like elastase family member 2A n=1 Tax=Paramacrobiotus metropolitanus TaxID=2943436 RepID=UPI0024459FB1|nr:chymotrypsin-like elastase family member 2A [Paramacrobiotus metropolitanus]
MRLKIIVFVLLALCMSKEVYGIVNGQLSRPHRAGYQVALLLSTDVPKIKKYDCGGYIVTNQWAMTAGHCCSQCSDTRPCSILVGAYDLKNKNDPTALVVPTERFVIHKNYKPPAGLAWDACLVKFARAIDLNAHTKALCVASQTTGLPLQKTCKIRGWGVTQCTRGGKMFDTHSSSGSDEMISNHIHSKTVLKLPTSSVSAFEEDIIVKAPASPKLKKLHADWLLKSECKKRHVLPDFACALTKNYSGPYSGDSGGPLTCKALDGKYYAYGHFITGECKPVNEPGSYVDSSLIFEWVAETVGRNEINKSCR